MLRFMPDYRRNRVPGGLRRSPGLHAFQPSQARSGGTPGGLAVLLVSAVRRRWAVSGRVDWRPRRATRNGRAAVRRNRRAAQRKAALQPLPPTTGSALRPARTRSGLTSTGDGSRRNALRFFRPTPPGAYGIGRHAITAIALYAWGPFKPVRGADCDLKEFTMPDLDQKTGGTGCAGPARAVRPGSAGQSRGPRGCRDHVNRAARLLLAGEGEALTRKAVEPALAGDPAALRAVPRTHRRAVSRTRGRIHDAANPQCPRFGGAKG
jgi:hypothetical protein